MSPVGAIFVPFPPKTGTNLLHPRPPPIVYRVFLRSYAVVSSLFILFVFFKKKMYIVTMSFAGYFLVLSLLSAFPAYLRTFFRFDLVWFRLSCVHGWICSGSVNVR